VTIELAVGAAVEEFRSSGRIVIVGASLAGLRAAEALREEGFRGRLTIIGDEPYEPYDRPPLSKQVLHGWVPADHTTLPRMRARSFDAWRARARDSGARDEAANLLERVGLRGRENVRAKDLAYGERRALEIGLAIATSPRILFLDEPTSGLGAEGTARLLDLVQEIKRTLTLVIIEHDMRFLFRLADFINVIHWGQVIARGTPDALRDNEWVRRSALSTLAC